MEKHICPWYIGYFLTNPLRRIFQNPEKILNPYISFGMNVLEVGPGMGFFSLPLARLVGEAGKVFCVDLQEKMIQNLKRRAAKAGLLNRIEIRLCNESSLQIEDLTSEIDFALAFAVIHEVSDQRNLFAEINRALKKQGLLLISEPKGHVTKEDFEVTLSITQNLGLKTLSFPNIKGSHSAVLEKT
jgi:ubiquinone/menaquinone biosynthesis C-methylase UbiE